MQLDRFREFNADLVARLEPDPRVLGLIAAGSMAEDGHAPDDYSDHDFWLVTQPDAVEQYRDDQSWLPEPASAPSNIVRGRDPMVGLRIIRSRSHT